MNLETAVVILSAALSSAILLLMLALISRDYWKKQAKVQSGIGTEPFGGPSEVVFGYKPDPWFCNDDKFDTGPDSDDVF